MTLLTHQEHEDNKHVDATERECVTCGGTDELLYDVHAYSEISGDDTLVWQCAKCRRECAEDV